LRLLPTGICCHFELRIYRRVAKMAEEIGVRKVAGQPWLPRATSAAESALRLRPRRALSSAQPWAPCTTTTSPRNDFSSNGDNPLNFVSQPKGALQEAAPLPVSRLLHQSARHRVPMQVPQLDRELLGIPNVAIVIPFLPERIRLMRPLPQLRLSILQVQLMSVPQVRPPSRRTNLGPPGIQSLRKRRLQKMNRIRQRLMLRLADQQMHVLRHTRIPNRHRISSRQTGKSSYTSRPANFGSRWRQLRVTKWDCPVSCQR